MAEEQADRRARPVLVTEPAETPAPPGRRPEDEAPWAKSPEEFYQELIARPEVREFLRRLADL